MCFILDDLFRAYLVFEPSNAEFKAYRQIDGVEIPEAILAVRLNNSRLVHGRLHVRPDIMDDIEVSYIQMPLS